MRHCAVLLFVISVAAGVLHPTQNTTLGAYSALAGNCPGAIPDDEYLGHWVINDCLAAGGDVILDDGAYLIGGTLNLTQHGTKLIGTNTGAVLQATSDLYGRILVANWVDNFVIENIRFYGNKGERAWLLWQCSPQYGNRDFAKNVLLTGNGFLVDRVTSADALCGSAMEVEGSGFTIRNSRFLFNGYEIGAAEPWADGLTVWNCFNGWIHDNEFIDNTDVALILGGGSGCVVENNTIMQPYAYAFAGLMVWNFHGGNGDHYGSTYRNNTVSSGYNRLTYGVLAGSHPWNPLLGIPHSGSVVGNYAQGAVNNLSVDGISAGEIQANGWGAAQGNKQYPPGCSLPSAGYTAAHFGAASVQNGWISRFYHPGGCGS